ncbi:sugar transferase [Wenzhouxiangella sp. EGI_FJ10409]|uniref:sugar transferase n=1 Tax=Wenzhouxiangella sp. EGI_FJ10409 TaxID=3243767 RepID=UPI0035DDE009
MQRLFDILFSGAALIALSPILIPIMVVLRFTGEGEIFFVQPRVGLGGRRFGLLKFATMLKNSPNMGTGTLTLEDDPRVLPFGKFLRATKINELPQLINILKGDMSVIGPRPQTDRCFSAFPADSQKEIVKVRPGLSGIGSIAFRAESRMMSDADDADRLYDELVMPYKGQLEQWYVRNQSLAVYFAAIIMTAWVVIFPNSRILWRSFPSLPTPPDQIARDLYAPATDTR